MSRTVIPASIAILLLSLVVLAGCQQSVPAGNSPAATSGGGPPPPPPPPGGAAEPQPAAPAPAAPAPAAAASSSGLPADLIAKIDKLIASHKEYIAKAEEVQNSRASKDRVDEFSLISQRSSDALDDVMIASAKLKPSQQSEFETYMNKHVTNIATTRRQHQLRLEGLLRQ